MQIDIATLRKKIEERHMTLSDFSREIGINPSTLYRKIEGNGVGITIGEVHRMVEVLGLSKSEAIRIFLPQYSQ